MLLQENEEEKKMTNSITLFKQFVPLLDEVYKEASKTAVLDGRPELVQAGANAVTYTPPTTRELFRRVMDKYREE